MAQRLSSLGLSLLRRVSYVILLFHSTDVREDRWRLVLQPSSSIDFYILTIAPTAESRRDICPSLSSLSTSSIIYVVVGKSSVAPSSYRKLDVEFYYYIFAADLDCPTEKLLSTLLTISCEPFVLYCASCYVFSVSNMLPIIWLNNCPESIIAFCSCALCVLKSVASLLSVCMLANSSSGSDNFTA